MVGGVTEMLCRAAPRFAAGDWHVHSYLSPSV
jgi:hypothetical protein